MLPTGWILFFYQAITKAFLFFLQVKEDIPIPHSTNIMIDGFKLRITEPTAIKTILSNSSLDFRAEVSTSTGEQSPVHKAYYRSLRLKYLHSESKPVLYIGGCLPAYYTGLNNFKNLPWSQTCQAVRWLQEDLKLPLSTAVIKLEYGLNFSLPSDISATRFIENILVYKGKLPDQERFNGAGVMARFKLAEFGFKIYDKSAQHKLHSNVVRYELAANRKSYLNKAGIYTVDDLSKQSTLSTLQKNLVDAIRHFVFYDHDIEFSKLNRTKLKCFFQFKSAQAWERLMVNNPELYRKKRKTFATAVTKASGVDWNQLFHDNVKDESSKLSHSDEGKSQMETKGRFFRVEC